MPAGRRGLTLSEMHPFFLHNSYICRRKHMMTMFRKLAGRFRDIHLSLRQKLVLSLGAVVSVLFISSVISILEYRQMSHYLSGLMADNIRSINTAHAISAKSDEYNLRVLEVIGDENVIALPEFDHGQFMEACAELKNSLSGKRLSHLADSVLYSYSAYMLVSMELNEVMLSDFIDSRTWFFERLQPRFHRLQNDIDLMTQAIYDELKHNSETFDKGFYRSIIPGAVAVAVGIFLVIMLLVFINVYYITPLYKMLGSLSDYRSFGKRYSYEFDGDDQMAELNAGVKEMAEENRQLRRRVKDLREALKKDKPL